MTLLLYSKQLSPRLQYVARFIAGYFQLDAQITTEENFFASFTGPKICYHPAVVSSRLVWIQPHAFLFQNNIAPQTIFVFEKNNSPAFFKTDDGYGFDLLSAIFYLLSRYEEYLPHKKDKYGRYDHRQTLAFQNNFLHLPLINSWLENLRQELEKNCLVSIVKKQFHFVPTYDVDIAWCYRHKGWQRNVGGALQSLLKGNISAVKQRINVLAGREEDPFDVYDDLRQLHERYSLRPVYFFHVGTRRNRYDKAVNVHAHEFKSLVRTIGANYEVGLHPSWASNDDVKQLSSEKNFLESVIEKKVVHSRQHYLKFDLPQTFRNLIQRGITDEYSMGWGGSNGFRASVAAPFFWYDLEREEETVLRLHPFPFMEATSLHEQGYNAAEALAEMKKYCKVISEYGGVYYVVWHPHFLSSLPLYQGWRQAYENFLEAVSAMHH